VIERVIMTEDSNERERERERERESEMDRKSGWRE
jgi:hypothetical protein